MKKWKVIGMICQLVMATNVVGQNTDNAIPLSAVMKLSTMNNFSELSLKLPNNISCQERNIQAAQSGLKAFYFAEKIETGFTPENAGTWQQTRLGRVWRLGIRSPGAYSLYLTFASLKLNKGVSLFIYGSDYKNLKGPFTLKNNNKQQLLSIAPIPGDELVIELDVPANVNNYGSILVSKIYHDVVNVVALINNQSLQIPLNSCDQNINCENGIYWQTEKRAVCKIITDGGLSTGTMIGNTAKSQTPYLITSYHSIFDNQHAAEAIFIFNHEYVDCGETIANTDQTLSGASLLANAKGLDYSLLKLNDIPPASYHPYYAGWNIQDVNPQSGVCIHHPGGLHKQIAIDYHPLSSSSFGQGYLPYSDWEVLAWDIGSTAPGSSGAPLFDPQHRLVGTLTGGSSSCNVKGSDYFNKFSRAWAQPSDSGAYLKTWLDPTNSGAIYIDGYDPYGFNGDNCSIAWHIMPAEIPTLSSSGQSTGYISGHNSSGITAFAEKFNSQGTLLVPGFYLNVAKATAASPLSHIAVKVWLGNDVPTTEIYSKTMFIKDFQPMMVNHIILDSIIKVSGNFFVGYQINYDFPGDEFAVFHAPYRGKNGASSMYVFKSAWQNSADASEVNDYSTSLGIGLSECYGKVSALVRNEVLFYPNPSKGYVNITMPEGIVIDEVSCSDVSGRRFPITFQASEIADRIYFNLPPGIYVVIIKGSGKQFYGKLVVSP